MNVYRKKILTAESSHSIKSKSPFRKRHSSIQGIKEIKLNLRGVLLEEKSVKKPKTRRIYEKKLCVLTEQFINKKSKTYKLGKSNSDLLLKSNLLSSINPNIKSYFLDLRAKKSIEIANGTFTTECTDGLKKGHEDLRNQHVTFYSQNSSLLNKTKFDKIRETHIEANSANLHRKKHNSCDKLINVTRKENDSPGDKIKLSNFSCKNIFNNKIYSKTLCTDKPKFTIRKRLKIKEKTIINPKLKSKGQKVSFILSRDISEFMQDKNRENDFDTGKEVRELLKYIGGSNENKCVGRCCATKFKESSKNNWENNNYKSNNNHNSYIWGNNNNNSKSNNNHDSNIWGNNTNDKCNNKNNNLDNKSNNNHCYNNSNNNENNNNKSNFTTNKYILFMNKFNHINFNYFLNK